MRVFFALGVFALFSTVGAIAADEKPSLTVTQDGKDLVVTTEVVGNNSAHALMTSVSGAQTDKVTLHACVFQNSDLLVRGGGASRSLKKIKVKWRLPDTKKEGKEFSVQVANFVVSTEALKALQPQIGKLVEEGEKFKKSTKAKK